MNLAKSSDLHDTWLQQPRPLYGSLDAGDYADLGLKSGLEIHQQLMTERKLFCRCPAGLYTTDHDVEILRHMRPTLSEMGEYDGTALMEFKTKKEIIYQLNDDSVCTYEMDDAPPFELNREALDQATAIAMLLGCKIVGEIHITRKQYLDGSIPTGFQRTTIVGVDGVIPFRERQVRIRQLALEEDSCREVSDAGHVRTYRTDRLGMPLIETVTEPDMHTPEEVAAVGQILRRLVRVTDHVRTGSGAARQDVNVSVTGGTRIEIKGVSSLRAIPRLVHNEALRQRSLVGIQGELKRRSVTAESIRDFNIDVTPIVRGTGCQYVQQAVSKGATVMAVPLPGFAGLLGVTTQPRTRFLKEFSDRIRVVACIDDLPNLVCSTEETPSFSSGEWEKISKACGVSGEVPVLVVWGRLNDVQTAAQEITIRAREACQGVPSETRQALDDGTNGFERILPGPDRMYPDTDLPPIPLDDTRVKEIASELPETPWQRQERMQQRGVGADLAERLSRHPAYDLYLRLVDRLKGDSHLQPGELASLLLDRPWSRPSRWDGTATWWEETVDRLVRGEIIPEGVYSGGKEPVTVIDEATGRKLFTNLLDDLPDGGPPLSQDGGRPREMFIMDHVMQKLRGKVRGRTVRKWVRETLKESHP
jgi:glutamyl-tRNA(Gln) amidotransferase subunit E